MSEEKTGDEVKPVVFGLTGFGVLPTDYNVRVGARSLEAQEYFEKKLGWSGLILYGSKLMGSRAAEKAGREYIPNANIFLAGGYKVWFGDFETTPEALAALKGASALFGVPVYVLREHDGRFPSKPIDDDLLAARYVVRAEGDDVRYRRVL